MYEQRRTADLRVRHRHTGQQISACAACAWLILATDDIRPAEGISRTRWSNHSQTLSLT
jgi:hypothetical protein